MFKCLFAWRERLRLLHAHTISCSEADLLTTIINIVMFVVFCEITAEVIQFFFAKGYLNQLIFKVLKIDHPLP